MSESHELMHCKATMIKTSNDVSFLSAFRLPVTHHASRVGGSFDEAEACGATAF